MILSGIDLRNWGPYHGDQRLDLTGTFYGVEARRADDAESSNGSGKCLSGETVVYDPKDGPILIEQFVAEKRESILGYRDGKIVSVPVIAHSSLGPKKMVRITTEENVGEKYGQDHPILTPYGFVRASEIRVGDWIALARHLPVAGSSTLSPDEAALVACALGDGVKTRGGFTLCACLEDKVAFFRGCLSRLFPKNRVFVGKGVVRLRSATGWAQGTGPRSEGGSAVLREWMDRIGFEMHGAAGKRVPQTLLAASEESVRSALGAFWLTDGYVSTNTNEVSYTSASRKLAWGVRYLLLRLGLQSSVNVKWVDGRPYYTVKILTASFQRMVELIDIPGEKGRLLRIAARSHSKDKNRNRDTIPHAIWSKEKLKRVVKLPNGKIRGITSWECTRRGMSREVYLAFGGSSLICEQELRWTKVVKVQRLLRKCECFDVQVDSKEHAYVAGEQFAIVHNSMLLEAIPFAPWGWLNSDRGLGVDDWISDGASDGHVRLTFDDGWWVMRERDNKLSKEKERVSTSSGTRGDEAVREAEARLGLSCDDLFAARYLRQRQAARFVLARPEERMAVVGDWLRLGPLESAEKASSKRAAELEKDLASKERLAIEARAVRASQGILDEVRASLAAVGERVEQARGRAELARLAAGEAREERSALAASQKGAERYAAVVAEGKELAEELEGTDVGALEAELSLMEGTLERRRKAAQDAARVEGERRMLASGSFDGTCPLAGIQCPARAQINDAGERNETLHKASRRELAVRRGELDDQEIAVNVQRGLVRGALARIEKLARLREEALRLRPDAKLAKSATPEDEVRWQVCLAEEAIALKAVFEAETEERDLARRVEAIERSEKAVLSAEDALRSAEELVQVAREGSAVFRASRLRIARKALSTIERDANDALTQISEGLSFELSWAREGSTLAKVCASCGEPYPPSAKPKECARCGEKRGPSLVEKLEIVLSKQSGALEDLVGVFCTLASARWLSEDRGSAFASIFLDECTSHLDKAHLRVFSRKLPSILSGMGVRQGFVVSHAREAVEVLPDRIIVTSDGKRSTVRVA